MFCWVKKRIFFFFFCKAEKSIGKTTIRLNVEGTYPNIVLVSELTLRSVKHGYLEHLEYM